MMVFLMLLALMGFPASHATARETSADTKSTIKLSVGQSARYARLPLQFEVNEGQADGRAKFLARGRGYTLFLTPEEAVLALKQAAQGSASKGGTLKRSAVLRVKLEGREEGSRIVGEEELGGRSNYFVGKNPAGWHTQIRTYGKVRYREVYRGVDLVYHGRQGEVEQDFEVGPGRDVGRIRLRIAGAQGEVEQ